MGMTNYEKQRVLLEARLLIEYLNMKYDDTETPYYEVYALAPYLKEHGIRDLDDLWNALDRMDSEIHFMANFKKGMQDGFKEGKNTRPLGRGISYP